MVRGRGYVFNGCIDGKTTPTNERFMSATNVHGTERRLTDGQDMRLRICQFQELFSISSYKNKACEVMVVTEKFYEFFKDGLPFSRMLILRKELVSTAKAKQRG